MLYGNPFKRPARARLDAWRVLCALAGLYIAEDRAAAQGPLDPPTAVYQQPLVGSDLVNALAGPRPPLEDAPVQGRVARFRLFRMMPGFLSDSPGLDSGDDPVPAGDPAASLFTSKDGDALSRIQVAMGGDNPFFDYRWRGDPGGVGYYKVHSQVQLLDNGYTSLCVNCQAFTPAGLEAGGAADGPTVICPSFGWFQELWGGTAIQGYIGSNYRTGWRLSDNLEGGYHYGVAWQCPLPGLVNPADNRGVYLFMQALGRYRYEGENQPGKPATWEFMPGIHWHVADSCWMSIGASRNSLLTCSWRF